MAQSHYSSCTVQDSQPPSYPLLYASPGQKCSYHPQPSSAPRLSPRLAGPITPTVMETVALGLIRKTVPQFSVQRLDIDISIHSKQMYWARGTDGNTILITLEAPPWVRLLRCERDSLSSEGGLLKWLSTLPPHGMPRIADCQNRDKPYNPGVIEPENDPENEECNCIIALPPVANYVFDYLPCLIAHGFPRVEPKSPEYVLSYPRVGTPMSMVLEKLHSEDMQYLQWQTGQLLRRTAFHESPTGRFGPAEDVLRRRSLMATSAVPLAPVDGHASDLGSSTWPLAFLDLAEGALRDLQNARVHIDYIEVKREVHRFLPLLGRVRRPSLVALNGGKDNILVDKRTSEGSERFEVNGLRDWSMCIFGDPLMSVAFTESPSPEFLDGIKTPSFEGDPFTFVSVVEDQAHAEVRLLLYECYHAMVQIAKAYHGPRQDGSIDQELPARARLQRVLSKLADLGDDGRQFKGSRKP